MIYKLKNKNLNYFYCSFFLIICFSSTTNELNDLGYALSNWSYFYHENDLFLNGQKKINSLLLIIAAHLHYLEVNYFVSGYILNLISNTIAVTSIFSLSYLITKKINISILCSIFLVLIYFPNVHNYGVKYFNYYIFLGNFAFWLSVLVISLHILEFNRTKNFLLSALFFIHFYWFLFLTVIILFDILINKKKILFKNLIFFLLPFVIFFSYMNNNFLVNNLDFENYYSLKYFTNNFSEIKNNNHIVASNINHNIIFKNKETIEQIKIFIMIISFNLLFILYTYKNYNTFNKYHQTLSKLLIFSLINIIIFIIYINLDSNLILIEFISKTIAEHFYQIYPNRFLNIIIIYICIIMFLTILNFIQYRKSYFYIFSFLLFLSLISKFYFNFYIFHKLDILSFIFFVCGSFFIFLKKNIILKNEKKLDKSLIIIIFLCFSTQILMTKFNNKIIYNSNYEILKNIKSNSLNLIGPNIYGQKHNHVYKMINSKLIFPTNNKIKINNYYLFLCNNSNSYNTASYYIKIKECFEKRDRNDWIEIKKNIKIDNIIVNSNYNLKLNTLYENKNMKIYEIK